MSFISDSKNRPRQPFWLPRVSVLQEFMAGDDAAVEVYLDAVIVYDNLLYQLLHDHAVICIHDRTALDILGNNRQPHRAYHAPVTMLWLFPSALPGHL